MPELRIIFGSSLVFVLGPHKYLELVGEGNKIILILRKICLYCGISKCSISCCFVWLDVCLLVLLLLLLFVPR